MNAERDLDGDGLSCREECLTGTDPLKRDTDGDGRDGALETGGWCLRHDCAHGVCACDGDAWLKVASGDYAAATLFQAEAGDWCWLHEQAVSNCVTCTGTADVTVPEFPYTPGQGEAWDDAWIGDSQVETGGGARVSLGFDRPCFIFEDAYLNSPTDRVERQSTEIVLRLRAFGGIHGGTLRVTTSKLSRLECTEGMRPADMYVLCPYEFLEVTHGLQIPDSSHR